MLEVESVDARTYFWLDFSGSFFRSQSYTCRDTPWLQANLLSTTRVIRVTAC